MIHTGARFTWTSLTLTWFAERSDTDLSAAAALRRAKDELEGRGAEVEMVPEANSLRFRATWPLWRSSWLRATARGSVHAERDAERILVTAQASLWPLILWPVPLVILFVVTEFSIALLVMLVLVLTWNAVSAYNGLRSVARAGVMLNAPEHAA